MASYENPQVKFYIIKEGDTLESIWQQHPYLSSWKALAEFNHLEYPYLVSPDTDTEEPASGYVIFSTNQVATEDITIPIGTLVGCNLDSHIYQYITQEEGKILTGQTKSNPVLIVATESGKEYNLPANTIDTVFGDYNLAVTNPASISGGYKLQVKKYGETLYIPIDGSSEIRETPVNFVNAYGIDIYVGDNLSSEFGMLKKSTNHDLLLVAGLDNLKQALIRRVITPQGSLLGHPEYGSQFAQHVGKAISYQIPELLKIETSRCLKGDPRVKDVSDIEVTFQGEVANITCTVTTYTDENFTLQFDTE